MIDMDTCTKLMISLDNFENDYNIMPNKIIIGYLLAAELCSYLDNNPIPTVSLEDVEKEKRCGTWGTWEGVPVFIDYKNPNTLEVGYMKSWKESKKI